MMVLGWLAMVGGAALFLISLGRTLRANPSSIVPYNREADAVPRHTVLMRSVGCGLLVAAAGLLGSTAGYWVVLAPAIIGAVAFIVVFRHNRGVTRADA